MELVRNLPGDPILRDDQLFLSAMEAPKLAFQLQNPGLSKLAAIYARSLAKNHPFADGNKRVAFAAAEMFLRENKVRLKHTEAEAFTLTKALAEGAISVDDYSAWLESNILV